MTFGWSLKSGTAFTYPVTRIILILSKSTIVAIALRQLIALHLADSYACSIVTVAGIVKAVELFTNKNYDIIMCHWEDMSRDLYEGLKPNPNITVSLGYPTEPGVQPAQILRVFVVPKNISACELHTRLLCREPAVYSFLHGNEIMLNPQCLEDGQISMVIQSILEVVGSN